MTEFIETARGDRRTLGVTVTMIDLEKLGEYFRVDPDVTEDVRETRRGFKGMEAFMSTGVIYNPTGLMRTINDEGVADNGKVDGEFADRFAVYTHYGYIEFPREVIEACPTTNTIDLAELVRVFGDRLERNFGLNYNWATGAIEGR